MPWHVCGTRQSSSGTSWRNMELSQQAVPRTAPLFAQLQIQPFTRKPHVVGGEAQAPVIRFSAVAQRSPANGVARVRAQPSSVPVAAVLIAKWDRATVAVSRGYNSFGVDPCLLVRSTNPSGITHLYFKTSCPRWRSGSFLSHLSASLGHQVLRRSKRAT